MHLKTTSTFFGRNRMAPLCQRQHHLFNVAHNEQSFLLNKNTKTFHTIKMSYPSNKIKLKDHSTALSAYCKTKHDTLSNIMDSRKEIDCITTIRNTLEFYGTITQWFHTQDEIFQDISSDQIANWIKKVKSLMKNPNKREIKNKSSSHNSSKPQTTIKSIILTQHLKQIKEHIQKW